MTLTEFKKGITNQTLPSKFTIIDKNHTLLNHYLDKISLKYNRKIQKIFDIEAALAINTDFDLDYTVYVSYLSKKDFEKVLPLISSEAMVIFITDGDFNSKLPEVEIGKLSHNANLLYLTRELSIKTKSGDDTGELLLSLDLIEEALNYFDEDLDRVVNELDKIKILDLTGANSWDRPFKALLECLPAKDEKMRSLKWFSGGDIDTCQVLYNIYIKKLRTLQDSPIEDQKVWSKLVTEAIWSESCIVSGLVGDYISDYLKLVENSLPSDFKVEYFPPVFFNQLVDSPEWGVDINKIYKENNNG